jgi:hypothetical protein
VIPELLLCGVEWQVADEEGGTFGIGLVAEDGVGEEGFGRFGGTSRFGSGVVVSYENQLCLEAVS